MGVIRKTKSVTTILSYFSDGHQAISVVDLVERLSSDMNKTTVYRVLDRLEDEGLIHSFSGAKGLTWYAKCHDCSTHSHQDVHPHFECKECGKVECLDVSIELPQINNRHIETADVLLTGQCDDCKNL